VSLHFGGGALRFHHLIAVTGLILLAALTSARAEKRVGSSSGTARTAMPTGSTTR
jgi:hypothetical protein